MGFFSRGDHEDADQSESLARTEQGGIPSAEWSGAFSELAVEGSLFTSGLSVARVRTACTGWGRGRWRR